MKTIFLLLLFVISIHCYAPPFAENHLQKVQEFNSAMTFLNRHIFIEAIAYSESRNNPMIVNSLGYVGLFQFGEAARRVVGAPIITKNDFRQDTITKKWYLKNIKIWPPEEQYLAMVRFMERNENILVQEIEQYSGKVICGILVTKSGMLAAAHLAGTEGVKKFLRSNGQYNPHDLYDTKITTYLLKFQNYQL